LLAAFFGLALAYWGFRFGMLGIWVNGRDEALRHRPGRARGAEKLIKTVMKKK
jgi:hypothetical protein